MMFKNRRALITILFVVILAISGFYLLRKPNEKIEQRDLSAAIVDGLSKEFPNPSFVENATDLLESNDYTVEYYNRSQVTLELYKTLPKVGYDLILLRIHSAPMDGDNPGAAFFTSESQQGLYFTEQLLGWVRRAKTLTRGDRYYAATPGFFYDGMDGEFNDTVIITMSCYGAIDDTMAKIFIGKGAKAYIGWDEKVTANYMDEAILALLEHYINKGETLKDSVKFVKKECGKDPTYQSQIILFTRS